MALLQHGTRGNKRRLMHMYQYTGKKGKQTNHHFMRELHAWAQLLS